MTICYKCGENLPDTCIECGNDSPAETHAKCLDCLERFNCD